MTVTEDTTRLEIAETIGHLRAKQQAVQLEATRAELQAEIDALLEKYPAAL